MWCWVAGSSSIGMIYWDGSAVVPPSQRGATHPQRATEEAMASEIGRTFTADLERATSEQRRNYGHAEDSLERAEQKIAATQEKLEKFAVAMAEATVTGSPQPPAALDLKRQKEDAEKMATACRALIPERKRLLEEAEKKWREQARPAERERVTQQLDAALVQLRAADQALAAIE